MPHCRKSKFSIWICDCIHKTNKLKGNLKKKITILVDNMPLSNITSQI